MKNIKRASEIEVEKKRLARRREELEKALHYDWRDMRESLYPKNIVSSALTSWLSRPEKRMESDLLANTLSGLSSAFTRNIVLQAEQKLAKLITRRKG